MFYCGGVKMTKIEKIAHSIIGGTLSSEFVSMQNKQKELDRVTSKILGQSFTAYIIELSRSVYGSTASEHLRNPHTQGVTEDLVHFMRRLP